MKYLLYFLILLFFGLLQSTIIPINFLLIFSVLYAINSDSKEGYVWAFSAGFIKDLLTLNSIGPTSVFFLFVVLMLNLYGRKYKLTHINYLLPFITIMILLSFFLFKVPFNLIQVVFSVVVFVLFSPLIKSFFARFDLDGDQLRLME